MYKLTFALLPLTIMLACGEKESDTSDITPEEPAAEPEAQPEAQPSSEPEAQPTSEPTSEPEAQPSSEPEAQPTSEPTSEPNECDDKLCLTIDLGCYDGDGDGNPDAITEVALTGPWFGGWDPAQAVPAIDNGDGTWTVTMDYPTEDMEYKWMANGAQEDLVAGGNASGNWTCTPITDYGGYANRQWVVGTPDPADTFGSCLTCEEQAAGPSYDLVNPGFEDDFTGWLIYPSTLTNYSIETDATTAAEGTKYLHIMGTNDSNNPTTPIYQQFPNPAEGTAFTFTAKAMIPSSAAFVDPGSVAQLVVKAFDTNWGLIGDVAVSNVITSTTTTDTWTDLSVDFTTPAGVANIQFVMEYTQINGDTGVVYFDDTAVTVQ